MEYHQGMILIGKYLHDPFQAFEDAWVAACKVEGSTVMVPADYVFFVGPISFSGPYCQPDIVFQVNIIVPRSTVPPN